MKKTIEKLWQELLEKDDRTSPADYPDMALVTFEEFADALAALSHPEPVAQEAVAIPSEAEPVAWMRDYPDMTCLTTTKPEPPEPGWRDIWMPLYATPPDSDAVRALRKAADYIAPYLLWTISEESPGYHPTMRSAVGAFLTAFDIETQEKRMVRLRATLSNQGSSSNG